MSDIDDALREMFRRRENDVLAPSRPVEPIVRRTRRHQAGIVMVALISIVAVVLVPLLGLRLHRSSGFRPATEVVLPDAPPGFQAAAVPYASIAYPTDWYLLDTSPLQSGGSAQSAQAPGPILQLASFDPDIPHSPRCMVEPDSIPANGVLLTVGVTPPGETPIAPPSGAWPVELSPFPSNVEPVCSEEDEQATWTTPSGVTYWATAGWGAKASQDDIDAMHRAFASLEFPPNDQPWLRVLSAFQGQGTPRAVLGTTTLGEDVLTFVAYLELDKTLWVGAESNGTWTHATAPHTGSDPNQPVSASLSVVGQDAALLDGTISPEVSKVEVRTDSGDSVPMQVAPLPASLGTDDRFVWALVPGAGEDSTVVGYDAQGNPIGNPIYPVGPKQQIAQGEEAGQKWTLSLTHDNMGWGLNFAYGNGSGGGGGSDLGGKIFGGASSGGPSWDIDTGWSTAPRDMEGVVTARAAKVSYQLVDGTTIVASLYPLPAEAFGGGAQAYLLFIPNDVLIQAGDLVAYDAAGNELGRLLARIALPQDPRAVVARCGRRDEGAPAGRRGVGSVLLRPRLVGWLRPGGRHQDLGRAHLQHIANRGRRRGEHPRRREGVERAGHEDPQRRRVFGVHGARARRGDGRPKRYERPVCLLERLVERSLTSHDQGASDLASGPRARPHDAPDHEERDHDDDLRAEHDPIHVDRRTPRQVLAADEVRADRSRREAESAARALALSVRTLAATAAGPAPDLGDRDHRDPVLLVRLAEHALHRDRVASAGDEILDVHRSSFGTLDRRPREHTRGGSRVRSRSRRGLARLSISGSPVRR
jgi:hypothetical protein